MTTMSLRNVINVITSNLVRCVQISPARGHIVVDKNTETESHADARKDLYTNCSQVSWRERNVECLTDYKSNLNETS